MACSARNHRCLQGAGRGAGIPPEQGAAVAWQPDGTLTYTARERRAFWRRVEAAAGRAGLAHDLESAYQAGLKRAAFPDGAALPGATPAVATLQDASSAMQLYALMQQMGQALPIPRPSISPADPGAGPQHGYAAAMRLLESLGLAGALPGSGRAAGTPGIQAELISERQLVLSSVSPNARRALVQDPRGKGTAVVDLDEPGKRPIRISLIPSGTGTSAWAPDGIVVALPLPGDSELALLNLETGKQRHLRSDSGATFSMPRFSPNGREIAVIETGESGDQRATIWDVVTGQRAVTLVWEDYEHLGPEYIDPDTARILQPALRDMQWSPCEQRVALAHDRSLSVRNASAGYAAWEHWGDSRIETVSYSSDGKLLACGKRNGLVAVFALASPADKPATILLAHPGGVGAVVLAPGGQVLASRGVEDDDVVRLWRVPDGSLLCTIPKTRATLLAFSPDSRRLVVGTRQGTTRVYRLADAAPPVSSAARTLARPKKQAR